MVSGWYQDQTAWEPTGTTLATTSQTGIGHPKNRAERVVFPPSCRPALLVAAQNPFKKRLKSTTAASGSLDYLAGTPSARRLWQPSWRLDPGATGFRPSEEQPRLP